MSSHSPSQCVLRINGKDHITQALPGQRLSHVLREECGLTGTKIGCDAGDCGACTVLVDGAQHCACLMAVAQVEGREVKTVEALADQNRSALQEAFLRHGAAQCGICTPGMLMAASSLLAEETKPDRTQIKDALGGVLCRCTGYQPIVEAIAELVDDTAPAAVCATPRLGQAVGANLARLDGIAKVDGTEIFGADNIAEEALLLRVVRSPHHHASFGFGDIEVWKDAHPDIFAVYTVSDLKGTNCFGVIPPFADQPALAQSLVRFRGEAVAIVAGAPHVMANLNLADFPVVWEPKTEILNVVEAQSEGCERIHEDRDNNRLISGKVQRGDADSALKEADHVVAGQVETGYVEHAYVEPEAGSAWMEGDVLCICASTQAPYMDRDDTAKVLGLQPDKVRIIPTAAGGGFGSKLDLSVQPLLGLVALMSGRPCRIAYSRSESMMSTTKRHPAKMTARIGANADGALTGMVFDGDFNTGAYASWGPTVAVRVPVHGSGPYLTPNYRAVATAVHTNGPPSGAFRGFGVPQSAILQETLYDKLADAIGMDRLSFRQKNALRDGDTSVCGQTLQAVGIKECLDALEPHWREALSDIEIFNAGSDIIKRGVGVASCWYGCGNTALPNPSTIRVGITANGRLILHQGATDIGQGSNTVISQICADALGLPLSRIELVGPDTFLTPDCGKTSASRQTVVTGNAARLAGLALREKILRLTNMGEGAELTLNGGNLTVSREGTRVDLDLTSLDVADNGYVLSAEETYDPPTETLDENGQGRPYAVYGYGAQLAIVDVDIKLGTVAVRKVVAAHDVGRAINPGLAKGQIEGGIAQGLGMALMEEYIPGRTENLHDYLIPTIGDMPDITSILIEKPDPEGPMGAKGLGEHALIPTAPAILNAIRHASGAEITRLPALPHRVWKAIKEKRAGQ